MEETTDLSRTPQDVAIGLGLDFTPNGWEDSVRRGDVTLIFDGLDELDIPSQVWAVNAISHLLVKHRAARVVVTSRPTPRAQSLYFPKEFEILPLSLQKATRLIENLKLTPEATSNIIHLLQSDFFNQYGAIVSNPLLLMVFTIAFQVWGRPLEKRLTYFYEQVFDALWILHDRTKEGYFERPRTDRPHEH